MDDTRNVRRTVQLPICNSILHILPIGLTGHPNTAQMSMIQRLIPWLSHGASGAASQRPVIFTRGSSGQNPFGPSVLRGYDEGVVFEVMRNDCIATVVLF